MATKRRRASTYNNGRTPWFKRLAAILLGIVILCGVAYGIGYVVTKQANPAKWFEKETVKTADEQPQGEMVITYNNSVNAPLSILPAENAGGGYRTVSAAVTSDPVRESIGNAVILQAKVYPDNASIKSCSWGLAWTDSQNGWATTKNVNEYITLDPDEEDTQKCKVTCNKVFEAQITLVCTSDDSEDGTISATCKLNFVRPITDGAFEFTMSHEYDGDEQTETQIDATLKWSSTSTPSYANYRDYFVKYDADSGIYNPVAYYQFSALSDRQHGSGTVIDGGVYMNEPSSGKSQIKKITITIADSVKSAVQSALGIKSDGYDVTNKFTYSIADVFSALLNNTNSTAMYNALANYYSANIPVLQYNVTITGNRTHKDYTFKYGLCVDCYALRTPVYDITPPNDVDFYEK